LNISVKKVTKEKKKKNFSEFKIDAPYILSKRIDAAKNKDARKVYSFPNISAGTEARTKKELSTKDSLLLIIIRRKTGGLECLLTISQVNKQAKGTVKKNKISSIGNSKIRSPKVYSSAKNQ
jgi:hypothetical protein